MNENTELAQDIFWHWEKCDTENLARIKRLNKILVTLSAAQLEYLLELSNLLFGQPPK